MSPQARESRCYAAFNAEPQMIDTINQLNLLGVQITAEPLMSMTTAEAFSGPSRLACKFQRLDTNDVVRLTAQHRSCMEVQQQNIRIRLLGAPEWNRAGDSAAQRLAPERSGQLLAYLAWSGQWVTREQLAEVFWPSHSTADARRNVRKLLFRLRERGVPPGFEDDGGALRWHVETDIARLLHASERHQDDDVMSLYRGPFLLGLDGDAGEGFAAWLANQRLRFDGLWRRSLLASLGASAPQRRRTLAQTLLAVDPLDETAALELAEAYRALGESDAAQQTIDEYSERLRHELGIEPSAALRQRVAGWRSPQARPAVPVSTGLPPAVDVFVGRRQELAQLRELLARMPCRWITVIGIGGIGKSRLLREALATIAPELGLAPVWVGLSDVNDADDVPARMAAAMGVAVRLHEHATQVLAQAIGQRAILLALDNVEQLNGWASTVEGLLAACPNLKIAVSSRERTHAGAEWLLPLDGLPQPDVDSRDIEAASNFDAVALFEMRARQAWLGFRLVDHLQAVLDIIASVDGMPLAIELAAAWTRVLTPPQIALELQRSPDLLSEGVGGRGLTAVFERSWDLLSSAERRAFLALAVFDGSFGAAQAAVITGLPMSVTAALMDKSMVQPARGEEASPAGRRLQLHPLLRHFARQRIQQDPAAWQALQAAHAACYASWVAERSKPSASEHELHEIAADLPNLESALRYAVEQGTAVPARQLTDGLWNYSRRTNRLGAAVLLFDSLLEHVDALPDSAGASVLRAPLLTALADLMLRQGKSPKAHDLARRAIREARRAGDTRNVFHGINTLAFALMRSSRPAAAARVLESTLPKVRSTHDDPMTRRMLNSLGAAYTLLGREAEAEPLFEESMRLGRAREDIVTFTMSLNHLARTKVFLDDLPGALRLYEELVAVGRQQKLPLADQQFLNLNVAAVRLDLGDAAGTRAPLADVFAMLEEQPNPLAEGGARIVLTRLRMMDRDFAGAREQLRLATRLFQDTAFPEGLANSVLAMGELLAHEGRRDTAATMLQHAVANTALGRSERRRAEKSLAALQLSETEHEHSKAKAHSTSVDAMTRLVLSL